MKDYCVSLVRWIEADDPARAAQEFIDDVGDYSWTVQVDAENGARLYYDIVPDGLQRDQTDLPNIVGTSQLRICASCNGKVEVEP